VQHGTGAEEQQALHERVVEGVIQHRDQGQRRERLHADALEHDGEADTGEQHADVLDRRVREQPLHVRLHGREDDAEQGRGQPEHHRREPPPPGRVAQQVERDSQHAVDRGLEHHAALRAEAEQRQPERDGRPGW